MMPVTGRAAGDSAFAADLKATVTSTMGSLLTREQLLHKLGINNDLISSQLGFKGLQKNTGGKMKLDLIV